MICLAKSALVDHLYTAHEEECSVALCVCVCVFVCVRTVG